MPLRLTRWSDCESKITNISKNTSSLSQRASYTDVTTTVSPGRVVGTITVSTDTNTTVTGVSVGVTITVTLDTPPEPMAPPPGRVGDPADD